MKTNCGFLGLFAISWGFFLNWGTSSPPSAAIRGNRGLCRETGSAQDREKPICTNTGSKMPLEGAAASRAQPGFGTGPGSQGLEIPPEMPPGCGGCSTGFPQLGTGIHEFLCGKREMRSLALGIPQLSFSGICGLQCHEIPAESSDGQWCWEPGRGLGHQADVWATKPFSAPAAVGTCTSSCHTAFDPWLAMARGSFAS